MSRLASCFDQVGEFHTVFGHPKTDTLQHDALTKNPTLVKFRVSLIEEEINEFYEAETRVDMLDAMCDIMYVTFGTMHALGIKMIQDSSYFYNASHLNYRDVLSKLRSSDDIDEFADFLYLTIQLTVDISRKLDFKLTKAFNEVHRSNMTKVCATEEIAQNSVQWYVDNKATTGYESPAYRLVDLGSSTPNQYWVVFDSKTSKILKSRDFELPSLKQFVV